MLAWLLPAIAARGGARARAAAAAAAPRTIEYVRHAGVVDRQLFGMRRS
jgi:hypothetical protein